MAGSRWVAAAAGAGGTAVLLVSGAISVVLWTLGPYVLDDRALDGAVRVAALTWAAADMAAAREQLKYEIDAAGIGPHVPDDACEFRDDAGDRSIWCQWTVTVRMPATEWEVPLEFDSQVALDGAGRLR